MAVTAAAAFLVAALGAPVFARVALRTGIVDHPGPLKVQRRPVPYLGGLAVLLGMLAPVALREPSWLLALVPAAALGLWDDMRSVPARVRLAGEVTIGIVAAWASPASHAVEYVLVVAIVVVLVNAVNLLDGLDALAAGVVFVSALGFAVLLDGDVAVVAVALAAALGGLLVWNRPPARIYLGDAGSYLLGTALALLLASALTSGSAPTGAGALLLVAVPVADTAVAILRRWRVHRPLFEGDRGHVYDQLVDGGWSPTTAVAGCVGAQAVFTGIGLLASQLGEAGSIVLVAGTVVTVGLLAVIRFTAPSRWSS